MNKQVIPKPAAINLFSYVGDTQGCGTIRIIYPHLLLPHIRMEGYRFAGFYSAYFIRQGDYYKHFTAITFQRAATKQHLALISDFLNKVSRPTNTPIIYEIDDLLIDIPVWNYAHKYYKENEEYIKRMMNIVHGLTVSTEKLKEVYSQYNPHIEVVPNHLPKFIWGDIIPKHENQPRETKPRILWAGSENHFAVAQMGMRGGDFGDELLKYIRKTTDKYQWVLCGGKPQEILDLIQSKKIEYHGWRNIFEYPGFLKSLDVDMAVAPLMPGLFNECKCLVGNTKVISNEGIIDIKDIKSTQSLYQSGSFEKISSSVVYPNQKTIKIITKLGYSIEGTPNHKILQNKKYIRLDELNIGNKVDLSFFKYPNTHYIKERGPFFLTKKLNSIDFDKLDNDMLPTITLNEKWGYFLGMFLGDGNMGQNNSVNISCDSRENIVDIMYEFGKSIGLNISIDKSDKRNTNGVCVRFSSRNLNWLLSNKFGFNGGKFKKNLNVPSQIKKSPKSVIREFIKGLFDADGWVTTTGCAFTTKNKQLAEEIQFLLLGFDILSRVSGHFNTTYQKTYYTLHLNRQATDIFYKEIGFACTKKQEKLEEIISKPHSNKYKKWEMNDEIVDIQIGYNDVYDVEIPNNHFYIANGFVSHNSNIKMLEYTALGIPAVYSKIEPYKNASLQGGSDGEIIEYIERLAGSLDLRRDTWERDYETLKDQLWWEDNNFKNIKHYINASLSLFDKKIPF